MTFFLGVVDRAEDGTLGIWFPDLPGCTSAGTDVDDLFARSIEAVRLWAEDAIGDGETLPTARGWDALMSDRSFVEAATQAGPKFPCLQVPLLLDAGRTVRANISIDAGLLDAIDAAAKTYGLTRSAFLASAARDKIARGA